MFGETIDYHILKPLTHSRNRATEDELDQQASCSSYSLIDARDYVKRLIGFFDHRFSIDTSTSYLDIGCGMGRFTVGLTDLGATDVTGVDIVRRNVREAEEVAERLLTVSKPQFVHADIHDWSSNRQYDVIVSIGAMEHIHSPATYLHKISGLMKPGGRAFVSFEPFQSPVGDHMSPFFNIQIPWRGLIFSERAILRLRTECYRPTDPVSRYQDVIGGLNLMTFSQYLRWADDAGLEFIYHNFNPQLRNHKRLMAFYPLSWVLSRIPKIRDYIGVCIFSILRHREN